MNVRVSVLTLYGTLVTTQAPLPEVQLLLQQPEGSRCSAGSFTPQESALSWRQRDGVSSPSRTPCTPSQRSACTHSPSIPHTPAEEDSCPPWLLQLCVSVVTQPREEHSDSEGGGQGGSAALDSPPVRLEALQVRDRGWHRKWHKNISERSFHSVSQVMCHLVRGYFPLVQAFLHDIGKVSARCLRETDPSVKLYGTKVLPSTFSLYVCDFFAHCSAFCDTDFWNVIMSLK